MYMYKCSTIIIISTSLHIYSYMFKTYHIVTGSNISECCKQKELLQCGSAHNHGAKLLQFLLNHLLIIRHNNPEQLQNHYSKLHVLQE